MPEFNVAGPPVVQIPLAEYEALRTAVAESGAVLEALHYSVQWELASEIKAEIARVLPLVRAALGPAR